MWDSVIYRLIGVFVIQLCRKECFEEFVHTIKTGKIKFPNFHAALVDEIATIFNNVVNG